MRLQLFVSALSSLLFAAACSGTVTDFSSGPKDNQALGGAHATEESADVATFIYGGPEGKPISRAAAEAGNTLGSGDLTVIMLVDRSGSMASPWDGATKWEITKAALHQAIVGVEQELTVGAIFFPQEADCDVPGLADPRQFQLQRGDLFQSRLGQLGEATGAGTPMIQAFQRADEAVQQAIAEGALEGRLRVVLLTDGEPNCGVDNEIMVMLADSWREAGVEVYVMGLPGTEAARVLLDRIAGKEVVPGEPETPPEQNWELGDQGGGAAIAPDSQKDVDDSLEAAVR